MKYENLTRKMIGASGHKHLGNGFREVAYQRALAVELQLQGIPYERGNEMLLYYNGAAICKRRADF